MNQKLYLLLTSSSVSSIRCSTQTLGSKSVPLCAQHFYPLSSTARNSLRKLDSIDHRCAQWVEPNQTVFDAGTFSGEEPSSHLHPQTQRVPGSCCNTQGMLGNIIFTLPNCDHSHPAHRQIHLLGEANYVYLYYCYL